MVLFGKWFKRSEKDVEKRKKDKEKRVLLAQAYKYRNIKKGLIIVPKPDYNPLEAKRLKERVIKMVMRSREEIEKEISDWRLKEEGVDIELCNVWEKVIIELLLDIRELITKQIKQKYQDALSVCGIELQDGISPLKIEPIKGVKGTTTIKEITLRNKKRARGEISLSSVTASATMICNSFEEEDEIGLPITNFLHPIYNLNCLERAIKENAVKLIDYKGHVFVKLTDKGKRIKKRVELSK